MINSYLQSVESAVVKLFEARQSYPNLINELFKSSIGPVFVYNSSNTREQIDYQKGIWESSPLIKEHINHSEKAREQFSNEIFAMSVIDGSLLQIACKGIELYSQNDYSPEFFEPFPRHYKYAVGRNIRGVPEGLIIYAGRNHYNHLEDGSNLRKPTLSIINELERSSALHKPYIKFVITDKSGVPVNIASNFVELLGWESPDDFFATIVNLKI